MPGLLYKNRHAAAWVNFAKNCYHAWREAAKHLPAALIPAMQVG